MLCWANVKRWSYLDLSGNTPTSFLLIKSHFLAEYSGNMAQLLVLFISPTAARVNNPNGQAHNNNDILKQTLRQTCKYCFVIICVFAFWCPDLGLKYTLPWSHTVAVKRVFMEPDLPSPLYCLSPDTPAVFYSTDICTWFPCYTGQYNCKKQLMTIKLFNSSVLLIHQYCMRGNHSEFTLSFPWCS